jgi:hypothetical protein
MGLWQQEAKGVLFSSEDLAHLHETLAADTGRDWSAPTAVAALVGSANLSGFRHITVDVASNPMVYERLQNMWWSYFQEPLLVGGNMQLSFFSVRWTEQWLHSKHGGVIHNDCEQLELCTSLLPPEYSMPEELGWEWDEASAVAIVIPIRIPRSKSRKVKGVKFANKSIGDAAPLEEDMKHVVFMQEGEYLMFHALRYHSSKKPDFEDLAEDDVDPRREEFVGFAVRQVPKDSRKERGTGRWLLLRMCRATNSPLPSRLSLGCSFCTEPSCSRCSMDELADISPPFMWK